MFASPRRSAVVEILRHGRPSLWASRELSRTGNAAAGNAYNVADMASLLQAVRNAGANNVVVLGAWRSTGPSFCAIGFISKKSAWLRQRSTCGSRRLAESPTKPLTLACSARSSLPVFGGSRAFGVSASASVTG